MENLNLDDVSAKALQSSTRLKLGEYLNPEQDLLTKDGIARDYRGLGDQMGFEYNEIRNFQRTSNPTLKILDAWTDQPNSTVGQLVKYIEKMGRHDIVQDMQQKFESDCIFYIQRRTRIQNQESPLQVDEITSCRMTDSGLDDSGILTRDDANSGKHTYYDGYVCCSDQDMPFGNEFVRYLESLGFKLFMPQRDMLAGHAEYEASLTLIQERCKRVIIILSPDFMKCPSYEAQISFAAGLGIDERCRKIIPIIYRPCEVPMMLKFISKIDFTKPGCIVEWVWDKVISSLRDGHGPAASFISSERRYPQLGNLLPLDALGTTEQPYPAITYPPTTSSLVLNVGASCSTSPSREIVQEDTVPESVVTANKSVKQKNKRENFRFWKLPKKNANDCSTSSSNVTSGFHSQMSDEGSESGTSSRWAQPFSNTWDRNGNSS